MTDITSSTGTYHWYYTRYDIPSGGNHTNVDPASLTGMSLAHASNAFLPTDNTYHEYLTFSDVQYINTHGLWGGSGEVVLIQDSTVFSDSLNPSYISGAGGGNLVATGAVYDTGVVQIYAYYYDTTVETWIENTQPPGQNTINRKIYRKWQWIYYAPTAASTPPIPAPVPVTLHLIKTDVINYTPKAGQEDILEKYRPGVASIRAQFDSATRIAVITPSNDGGFIIYEEMANAPSGKCYVYNLDRTLKDIVFPADLDKYLPQP